LNFYKNDIPSDVRFVDSVAVDTETMGLITKRDRLCLVQLCTSGGDVHIVQIQNGHQNESENLKKLLTDRSILKIFHFARFDVTILNYTFGINVNPIYCTKVASKLARTYTDKHGLKSLCKEMLGVEISKAEQSSDWGQETLTPDQLKYAAGDVLHLHKIKAKLDGMLEREKRMHIAQKCFETIHVLSELELININPEDTFRH
jgi:ribonuclease D